MFVFHVVMVRFLDPAFMCKTLYTESLLALPFLIWWIGFRYIIGPETPEKENLRAVSTTFLVSQTMAAAQRSGQGWLENLCRNHFEVPRRPSYVQNKHSNSFQKK